MNENIIKLTEDLEITLRFGDADSSVEVLKEKYPTFKISCLTQTHGEIVKHSTLENANDWSSKADGQFTESTQLLLAIKTADCIPILAAHPTGIISAFHAGWRGVENQITIKGLKDISTKLSISLKDWRLWIGPHIQFKSFEVDIELGKKFERQGIRAGLSPNSNWIEFSATKAHVALKEILLCELRSLGISPEYVSNDDTFLNKNLHSYRRERQGGARQLSVIGLRKSKTSSDS